MLNACRVSPDHEVHPWSYNIVDTLNSLRGKAGKSSKSGVVVWLL